MVFIDNMLPRQPLAIVWILAATLLVQDHVRGWTFPKSNAEIVLPVDFPSYKAFYRIPVLPDVTDNPKNLDISFQIIEKKTKSHFQIPGESRVIREKFLDIDAKNGTVWLIKRAIDTKALEKEPNGTIISNMIIVAKTEGGNPKRARMSLNLKFMNFIKSFCQPSFSSCFTSENISYRLSEQSAEGAVLDSMKNLAYSSICKESTIGYDLESDDDLLRINGTTGDLTLNHRPDAETTANFNITISCFTADKMFTNMGNVSITDINDNAPTTKDGNSTGYHVEFLKPGQKSVFFSVSAVDKDSMHVNSLKARIEQDYLELFKIDYIDTYDTLIEAKEKTFFNVAIKSKSQMSFPGEEYNFKIVIEDSSLSHEENKVVYYVSMINKTINNFVLQERYSVNVSRSSARYSRILQLSPSPSYYKFELEGGEKYFEWLGITKHSGILYVKNPLLIPSGIQRRNILWSAVNETDLGKNVILLSVTISDEENYNCDNFDDSLTWCSEHNNESSCISSCGPGSLSGFCSWRAGSLVQNNPHRDYATCSPDFSYCPDGECDELEEMYPTLCPQDCAREFKGEAVLYGSGQGLYQAMGPCFCPKTHSCICSTFYPPAEMRVRPNKSTPPTPDPRNDTLAVEELDIDTDSGSKDGVSFKGIWSAMRCDDVTCIASLAVSLTFLFLLGASLVLIRTMRVRRKSQHKFVSTHSISGVPSDYVDERSNSAQEAARNTPTESSSFGKSSVDSKWEFPRNRLQFQSILGEGEFGRVLKAQAWNIGGVKGFSTVAVKMIKENGGSQEKQDLMTEFTLLKEISHPNIIKLLGVCTEKTEPFLLIVEFAEIGSLRCYMRRRRRHNCCKYEPRPYPQPVQPVQGRDYYQYPCSRAFVDPNHVYFHKEQLSFAWQVAKGMTHLSHMKLVHRDLATRNILLTKQKIVKISDFGLSRDIYEGDAYLKKSRGRVPVKWMAIESLEDQIFTTRSDVWSFGVVLWEIMMLGATPYPGVTPQRLYNLLKAGYRMSKPDYCSDEIYHIMRQCWRASPRERPSFKDLVLKLDYMLQDTVEYMDFTVKKKSYHYTPKNDVLVPNEMTPSIQYTSVFAGEDEEQTNTQENEDIGLESLFDTTENSGTALLGDSSHEESPA